MFCFNITLIYKNYKNNSMVWNYKLFCKVIFGNMCGFLMCMLFIFYFYWLVINKSETILMSVKVAVRVRPFNQR
jgi:hypothetical protein